MTATTNLTRPNHVQRMMQHIASLRPVAAVFRHTFHHIDRWGLGILRGRTLSSVIAGVPNIMLTTTGAKTGKLRTVPLVGVPVEGGRIAVVGTRWGSEHNPGWSYNLTEDPHAVVERDGERIEVVARRVLDRDEYDAIMCRADEVYVGFPKYRRRISRRAVPVFVLE
jgi:deazaflavin-dependent oxidoreductase (nitroreductase family)